MKKVSLLLLGTLGMAVPAYGKSIMGAGNLSRETLAEPLEVMGPLTATTIKAQDIETFGPATLSGSTVGAVKIQGPLKADNTVFDGWAQVYGGIDATGSTFKDDITVYGAGSDIILDTTTTKDIIIRMGEGTVLSTQEPRPTRVVLKKGTLVNGSIRFIGVEGTIEQDDTSAITGSVFGATEQGE